MIHGLNNDYLYTAKAVVTTWTKGNQTAQVQGTGFFVDRGDEDLVFVTNQHVIMPGYSDEKHRAYDLTQVIVESYQMFDDEAMPKNLNAARISNIKDFVFAQNDQDDIACISNIKVEGGLTINNPISYDMLATEE